MTVTDAQARVAYWATAYGVPVQTALAVAQRESGFSSSARGASGEVGVMQLMPATSASLGVDPFNPEQNIEGGVRLLRDEYARFGDWSYALAAYNCGAACAARGPDHWPPSTYRYVSETVGLSAMSVAPNGGDAGGSVWDWAPDGQTGAPGGVTLAIIAAALGALLLYYLTD